MWYVVENICERGMLKCCSKRELIVECDSVENEAAVLGVW